MTALVEGVCTGNRLALARTMSRVEDEHADAHALLRALYPRTGQAHIIGVTGAPGHNAAHRVLADRSLLGRLLRRG